MKADIGIPDKPIFFRLPNIGELNMYSLFLRDAFIAGDLFLITFFVGVCVFGFIIISQDTSISIDDVEESHRN